MTIFSLDDSPEDIARKAGALGALLGIYDALDDHAQGECPGCHEGRLDPEVDSSG